jgi:hypothetical protein
VDGNEGNSRIENLEMGNMNNGVKDKKTQMQWCMSTEKVKSNQIYP